MDQRHKKKVCLEQNISIESFHASFHNFDNVSIHVKWQQKLVIDLSCFQIKQYKNTNICVLRENSSRHSAERGNIFEPVFLINWQSGAFELYE